MKLEYSLYKTKMSNDNKEEKNDLAFSIYQTKQSYNNTDTESKVKEKTKKNNIIKDFK